eukprot:3245732-Pyramimonas_sp.AAC.1
MLIIQRCIRTPAIGFGSRPYARCFRKDGAIPAVWSNKEITLWLVSGTRTEEGLLNGVLFRLSVEQERVRPKRRVCVPSQVLVVMHDSVFCDEHKFNAKPQVSSTFLPSKLVLARCSLLGSFS